MSSAGGEDDGISLSPKKIQWDDMDTQAYTIYGSLYILATNTLLYPSELLRTRLQADKFTSKKKIVIRKLLADIYRREGIPGLYKGYVSASLGSFPGQLIYYFAYEWSNQKILENMPSQLKNNISEDNRYIIANGLAGVAAEASAAFIYVPSDVLSQRLQVQNRIDFIPLHLRQDTAWRVSKAIWKNEGLKGFFRGYGPYLMVYGPGSAVWWGSYEVFRGYGEKTLNWLSEKRKRDGSDPIPLKKELNHLVSGALAGICSVMATNPLDVVRTRIQLLEVQNERDRKELRGGFFSMLRDLYRREGLYGLYKGVKPRVFISIPGSALAFVGYEYLKESSLIREDTE